LARFTYSPWPRSLATSWRALSVDGSGEDWLERGEARTWYEDLRASYRPEVVRVLLIGESPPDPGDGERRFFYAPTLSHDNLYRSVAEAIYGNVRVEAAQRGPWFGETVDGSQGRAPSALPLPEALGLGKPSAPAGCQKIGSHLQICIFRERAPYVVTPHVVRLAAATDVADELLERATHRGKYKPWDETPEAPRDWRKANRYSMQDLRNEIRGILRFDIAVPNPKAVVRIAGILPY
jgi:hypothetical protein